MAETDQFYTDVGYTDALLQKPQKWEAQSHQVKTGFDRKDGRAIYWQLVIIVAAKA